jgi:hypothetical protein
MLRLLVAKRLLLGEVLLVELLIMIDCSELRVLLGQNLSYFLLVVHLGKLRSKRDR